MDDPVLSPSCSGRRSSNSPEFEFWMVGNPSFPQPNLLSADELFSHGVLLPLHHLHLSNDAPPQPDQPPDPETSAADLSPTPALTSSKRWKDIFRKNEKKIPHSDNTTPKEKQKEKEINSVKEKRREKKNGSVASAAELNINIWPFSRSRSAGNGGTRPRTAAASRKVSSAPCSRSNSRGESKCRKWPSSPSRGGGGVHLGRSSPVWQVRRSTAAAVEGGRRKVPVAGGSKARVLSLNVPMCIGYRNQLSCRSGESGGEGGVRGGNLFNIKSLFTRKVL